MPTKNSDLKNSVSIRKNSAVKKTPHYFLALHQAAAEKENQSNPNVIITLGALLALLSLVSLFLADQTLR